jgi:radical SAM protein with 4Fe4S-binding SPASM domain
MDPVIQRGIVNIISGITEYGITKPQILKAPFLIVWNFTNLCNLECKHCYQYSNQKISCSNELGLDEKLQLVDELADAKVVSLAFSGGEPLMHKDLFFVLKEAKRKGMHTAIATNGTLITKEVAKFLKAELVDYIEISLDFPRPDLHDEFRGMIGAFDKAINGIKNCVAEEIHTSIATTVTKINLHYISEMIQLARELKVERFIQFNFIPTGRGKEIADLDISPEEREKLLKLLFNESNIPGMQVVSTAPQFSRVVLEESIGSIISPTHFLTTKNDDYDLKVLAEFIGGCGAGRLYGAIQPNGDVTPCVFIPQLKVGNVRHASFMSLWNDSEILKEFRFRDNLAQNCGCCEYKYVCGGCRARALSYLGDHLACDIGCIKNKDYLTGLKKEILSISQ